MRAGQTQSLVTFGLWEEEEGGGTRDETAALLEIGAVRYTPQSELQGSCSHPRPLAPPYYPRPFQCDEPPRPPPPGGRCRR